MYLYRSDLKDIDYLVYLFPPGLCMNGCLFCKSEKIRKEIRTLYPGFLAKDRFLKEFGRDLDSNPPGTLFLNGSGDLFSAGLDPEFLGSVLRLIHKKGYRLNFMSNNFSQVLDFSGYIGPGAGIGLTICSADERLNEAVLSKNHRSIDEILIFMGRLEKNCKEVSSYLFVSPVIPYVTQLKQILGRLAGHFDQVYLENLSPDEMNFKKLGGLDSISPGDFERIQSFYSDRKAYRKYFRNAMHSLKKTYRISRLTLIQH